MKTTVWSRSAGSASVRDQHAVRDHAVVAGQPARGRLGRHRRDGDPRVDPVHQEPPEVQRRAASSRGRRARDGSTTIGHCANESAATQIAGVIGSCRWTTSNCSSARIRRIRPIARGESTMFGSEPFAGTTTERPTGMIPSGSAPWRPVRGCRRRVNIPGRVVAHQHLHVVAAVAGAPRPGARRARRPRPSTTTRTARRSRSSCWRTPGERFVQALGAELDRLVARPRARGAPSLRRSARSPRPERLRRGARASSRSAVSPSGSRSQTKNVPSQTGRLRQARRRSRRGGARSRRRARRPSPAGPSSAAIAARCSGSKMPTRLWSFSRLMRSTISALPTTKPMRQPAIP